MGAGFANLLVSRVWCGALALSLALTGVAWGEQAVTRNQDYSEFWLWGGPVDQSVVARATVLYVLQGEVRVAKGLAVAQYITEQGASVPRNKATPTWLVYRVQTLDWDPRLYKALVARVHRWRQYGNNVLGIQIDFDASTARLSEYREFLVNLKQTLPQGVHLGITGLLDWTNRVDADGINALAGTVDEIVIQTYQGRQTIPNSSAYLMRLQKVTIPFKVGLVDGGKAIDHKVFDSNPMFQGYVVFMTTPRQ